MRRLALALLLAACGPSSAEVKLARGAVYKVNQAECQNAVFQALKADYRSVEIHEGDPALVASDWRPISFSAEGNAELFRIAAAVWVKDGGCQVAIDGVAAHLTKDMAVLTLYPHGASDEPTWVVPRIDHAYSGVYARLRESAVAGQPADAKIVEDWLRHRPPQKGPAPAQ